VEREIPIACSLTDKQLQERRKTVLSKVRESLIGSDEIENGFNYRFMLSETLLSDLATLMNLERKCCPFLNFKLILQSAGDIVSLELTGKNGTKETLKTLFEWN
jgi:hypothetical protein